MTTPRPFYFLRHGQTDWNVEGRIQGHTDTPLNSTGLQQAYTAAQKLTGHPITHIVSSPLIRALKTAAITAESVRLPVHVDSRLMERTFGSIEGKLRTEVQQAHGLDPHTSLTHALPNDAEQWPQTIERARTSVENWLNLLPNETLLFVGHGAFFRALAEAFTGRQQEAQNATPYKFTPTATGQWQMSEV
jgi:probable phosphoglycerate mutase